MPAARRRRGGGAHLIGRRAALQHRELRGSEGLRAERHAHAATGEHGRELVVDRLGVGLDGQLRRGRQACEQPVEQGGPEQRRCATAEEHRLQLGREPVALLVELRQHGVDVALAQIGMPRHRHEVAVAAAVRAERHVHVEVADQLGPPPRRVSCAAEARAASASASSRPRPRASSSVSAAMNTSPAP